MDIKLQIMSLPLPYKINYDCTEHIIFSLLKFALPNLNKLSFHTLLIKMTFELILS